MSKTQLVQSMGKTREEHAFHISMHANNWNQYAEVYDDKFKELNLSKWVVVNAEGVVIENNADKNELIHNADGTVRHEDFLVIKDKIVEVRQRKLNGIADLMANGLTISASLGDQLIGFENINEFQEAAQDMNPNSFDNNDTVYTEDFVPNPITHSSFSVPWRQQGFQYKNSKGMVASIRQVAERVEKTLFLGNSDISVTFNTTAFQIYGYTTHPNRGVDTISDWTLAANTGAIITETVTALGLMFADQGGITDNNSVIMYVANDIWMNLQNDFKANSDKSVMTRLLQISQIKEVKPAEKLTNGNAIMVEMEDRTVELAIAQDIVVVPHVIANPMASQHMTAYAAMVHKIHKDSNNNTGIMHLSP